MAKRRSSAKPRSEGSRRRRKAKRKIGDVLRKAWYNATSYSPREVWEIFGGRNIGKIERPKMIDRGEMDYTFLVFVVLVVAAGLVMLLSASAPSSKQLYGNSYVLFIRQSIFAFIGFVGMFAASRINYASYKKAMPLIMLICMILLLLVLLPGTGKSLNGSKRWLNIPVISLQPSEFVKPVIAMYFALMIEKGATSLKKPMGLVPYAAVIFIVVGLMLCETHLSGAVVIAGIAIMVLYFGGMPLKPIIVTALIVLPVMILVIHQVSEVRWARITSFLDPFADMQSKGYQISQAIYAIGSGKLFGLGLGQSVQKYSYLPEPYNDFIFAIICEELGLVGAIAVMLLFLMLIARGVRIALNAPDVYGTLVALGIVSQLAIQTIMNLAVATSTIPNTGVSLPFFSYGGTSIMTLLVEMGILLNISRHSIKRR